MLYLSHCHELCRCKNNSEERSKTEKKNYRPIRILPNLSKIYERIIYKQVCPYFDTLFKFKCGFGNGFNVQYWMLLVIGKWREFLDNVGKTGAVLTDLSKAFDCINNNLLIAKHMSILSKKARLMFFIFSSPKENKRRK